MKDEDKQANKSAAANRCPAVQSDGSGNLSTIVAADRALPAVVAELGRYSQKMPSASSRKHHVDQLFDADVIDEEFSNRLLIRGVAKKRKFKGVDFKYTIFDTCYLRLCAFEDCDFTGCRFSGCNLFGSTFQNCKFDYVVFERTQITSEILDTNCPGWENQKLKFARSLRMNFQSFGDSAAVNKAIVLELDATEAHLWKAWKAPEAYYRSKYRGWNRVKAFLDWLSFKALDLIWGNGESAWKLVRAVAVLFLGMALIHVFKFGDPSRVAEYGSSLLEMPQVLLGVSRPQQYSGGYLAVISLARLIAFGFFMAIVIKRFNRR